MTNKFQEKYRTSSPRLKGYDYSQEGAYFITICTKDKACILGEIRNERFHGNELSRIVEECWHDLPNHYKDCILDEFVVMPNHFHGILIILSEANSDTHHALPEIVRAFKSFTAKRINVYRKTIGSHFWQENYYDRVIRTSEELDRIREYITDNPLKWDLEKNMVENLKL